MRFCITAKFENYIFCQGILKFQIISLKLYFLSKWISAVRLGLVNA